ncbi:unnamed protein product [Oikopleura dioica]|uniref:SH3 domain-containing protein n=1 Tax=Oikopleura dioica TaxID=34765 RepID=E4X5B6_OIKDI|nr:unnamed protein product [Oikopleura dioica]
MQKISNKELEKKVDELAAENRELLTFVDESVRIAEEFKQKALLMGENLDKNVQLIFARALYEHKSRDRQELSLSMDEIIVIEGNIDDDGFYSAKNFKEEHVLFKCILKKYQQNMSAPAKKRKLSIFSLPKTEKEAKKISRLLIELQKDYFVNSLELEYEDENATGWIRCSGECTNKNKPFSAKGARQLICSEKIQRHMKNYHTLKNDSKSGAKKLKKEDIEEIQTSSARIIAQKSLSKGFYDSPEVKRRDELLITASGGERGTGEKLGLSRYKCEKLWKSSQRDNSGHSESPTESSTTAVSGVEATHELLTSFSIKNTSDEKLRLTGRLQRRSFILVSQNESFSCMSGPNISSVIQNSAEYCRVLELQADDQTGLNISYPIFFSEKRPSVIKITPSNNEAKVIIPETEDDFHLHLRSSDYQQIVSLRKGTPMHIFADLREATDYTIVFHGNSYVFTTLGKNQILSNSTEEQSCHIPSLKNLRGCLEGSLLRIKWDEYHAAKLYFRDGLDLLGTVKEGDATSLEINYDVNIDPQQVFCMEVTDFNGNSSLRERIPITMVVRALYDYLPETMSLNCDYSQELSFSEQDLLTVRLPMDKDGFYYGKNEKNNMQGLIPSNFVQPI